MSIIRRRQFKKRKKGLSTGKKKMLMIDGVLLLLIFLGMGFSALATDLGINGDIQLIYYNYNKYIFKINKKNERLFLL